MQENLCTKIIQNTIVSRLINVRVYIKQKDDFNIQNVQRIAAK